MNQLLLFFGVTKDYVMVSRVLWIFRLFQSLRKTLMIGEWRRAKYKFPLVVLEKFLLFYSPSLSVARPLENNWRENFAKYLFLGYHLLENRMFLLNFDKTSRENLMCSYKRIMPCARKFICFDITPPGKFDVL